MNIGFPTLSSHGDTNDEVTLYEYKQAVDHILKTWHPKQGFIMRTITPEVYGKALDADFSNELREKGLYDAVIETNGEIRFTKM